MQNHLESGGRSYTAMLQSSDPFGPPPSHGDYTTMSAPHQNSSPGSEYSHLLNSSNNSHSGGGGGGQMNNNHLHHNNNGGVNGQPGNGTTEKPKKTLPPNGKKTKGRVKIKMEFIDNKLRRYTTFSKRKTGIMKKAYELSTLTGTQVMLLVASETGHVYTFATRKLQPMITSEAGKALIQTCLNSPDPPHQGADPQRMSATGYEETELTYAADPNGSEHGDVKVRLSSSPYSAQGQTLAGLHHSPSMYGGGINNNYHGGGGPVTSTGMSMFPHSPSPNSNVLYHYPTDPQPPQCYPSGMHSPTPPHLSHLTR